MTFQEDLPPQNTKIRNTNEVTKINEVTKTNEVEKRALFPNLPQRDIRGRDTMLRDSDKDETGD